MSLPKDVTFGSAPRDVRLEFLRSGSEPDDTGLDHLRIDPAQAQFSSDLSVHKLHRLDAEARHKLLAACVRQRTHFQDGRTDREACARWKIFFAEVHVDIELIAGQTPTRSEEHTSE